MGRAKSERARSKTLAIDDLTQSIEQLQTFIPKLEDLGREGFPYLEGAVTRTELQLRECIKRAFGDKSPEFQTHRHLKLALASPTEKKQTLALIRTLVSSLEEKKLELQGLKPARAQEPAVPSTPPPIALVPPSTAPAQGSVTSVTPQPTTTTLHLVPRTKEAPQPAPQVASAPPPAATPSAPVESTPPPASPPAAQSIPPRTPIEPISTLFRTQETKPIPSPSEQALPLADKPPVESTPAASAPAAVAATSPPAPPAQPLSPAASTASPAPAEPTLPPPVSTFSTTQEIPASASASASPKLPSTVAGADAPGEMDPSSITIKLCQRFHMVVRQLRLRGEYRSTLNIEDESDVQDLMHALLRLHFDDIGTDEWTPDYSSGAPRTTFLLDHDRLAVVVKKTRSGLSRKDLADQVRIDVERYRSRGRFTHLLCFIYDPEGRIGNPRGLENDLTTISEHFAVDVVVAPK
jgi:hypothetical protein